MYNNNLTNNKEKIQNFTSKYSLFLILFLLMFVFSLANKHFFTMQNLINVLRQQSVVVIIAIAQMMLITGGMLDLSVGSVIAVSGVFSVSVFKFTGSIILAVSVGIAVAIICNIINGIMVTKFKVPAFIATLAMMTIARGMALFYTGGQNIYEIGNYSLIGQGTIGIIPVPVIIMVLLGIFMFYIMKHSKFGRSVYAVGGNEDASRASGLNIHMIRMKAYVLNGLLVGIAAVVFMSRVNGGLPNGAQGYEFHALTAAIIGGTSFSGGIGSVVGTTIGAFIVGFLNNIMNLLSINSYIQQMVRGVIIGAAVAWDIYSRSRHSKQ